MVDLDKIKNFKSILIKGAEIYDPLEKKKSVSDVLVEKGYIKSIDKPLEVPGPGTTGGFLDNPHLKARGDLLIIDASNKILCPAFMDMHVHLRDPGDENEETVASGVEAAFAGGITAAACMPNTEPPIDSEVLIRYLLDRARSLDFKLFPVAAMTKGIKGIEISEMGILCEAGAAAFSDDGRCVQDARLMYEIMKYASQFKKLLILHEEDYTFSASGLAHDGYYSARLGLDGISRLSEEVVIARDIMMAKKAGAKIHITHLSTKGSVELIKKAKEDGVNITCDVTPHHLYFDDSSLEGYDTNFKVNPPIRSAEDREALIEGITTGVIDTIASDHAPHLEIEKNTTFARAANGVIGMETLFRSAYTCLCEKGRIELMGLINLLSVVPYKILGIKPPALGSENKAGLVIIDTGMESVVKKDDFKSRSSNSPFIGHRLLSGIMCTINRGKIAYFNHSHMK